MVSGYPVGQYKDTLFPSWLNILFESTDLEQTESKCIMLSVSSLQSENSSRKYSIQMITF